jgi:hypothetical protein
MDATSDRHSAGGLWLMIPTIPGIRVFARSLQGGDLLI